MAEIINNEILDNDILLEILRDIAMHKTQIANLSLKGTISLSKARLKLYLSDRNILFELSLLIKPFHKLIGKFADISNVYHGITAHEFSQWNFIASVKAPVKNWKRPSLLVYDNESEILVLEKFQGKTALQTMKQAPLLKLLPGKSKGIFAKFFTVGEILASLHTQMPVHSYNIISPMKYSIPEKLAPVSSKPNKDEILKKGLALFANCHEYDTTSSWTHGNLRCDNLIFTPEGVAIIDLENAGAGDSMEDLGRLLALILSFQKLSIFPKPFLISVVTSIIHGYISIAKILPQQLLTSILGELLVIYGREKQSRFLFAVINRQFQEGLGKVICHIMNRIKNNPEVISERPELLISCR